MTDNDDPFDLLARQLRELRTLAGRPSVSTLASLTQDQGIRWAMPRSTVHDKLQGRTVPKLDHVLALVKAISRYAAENGRPLSAELTDPGEWRKRWTRAEEARTSVPSDTDGPHLDEGIAEPVTVQLLALDCSPTSVSRGQALGLEYLLRLDSGASLPVVLGASLVSRDGEEYYDVIRDREVELFAGTDTYRRQLNVASAVPEGLYRLIGAVWYPRIGGRRLAFLDRGFIVKVSGAVRGEGGCGW